MIIWLSFLTIVVVYLEFCRQSELANMQHELKKQINHVEDMGLLHSFRLMQLGHKSGLDYDDLRKEWVKFRMEKQK